MAGGALCTHVADRLAKQDSAWLRRTPGLRQDVVAEVPRVRSPCSKLLIDTLPGEEASQHRLVLVNNAAGMSRDEVHDCLSFGYSHKSEQDVGMFGLGFQHGTMGVGDSATLGSVRVCEDDETLLEVNVGLLSLKLMDSMKAGDELLANYGESYPLD